MERVEETPRLQGKRQPERPGWASTLFALFSLLCPIILFSPSAHAIMAGDEFGLPEDRPSWRIDSLGQNSPYSSVGGLDITSGSSNYYGTGVALSQNWILTAGHNVDFNDNGAPALMEYGDGYALVGTALRFLYNLPRYSEDAAWVSCERLQRLLLA
jgi:hypothetical protein